ncbi:MAG: septum formation initiator family protein [Prolixibacteraceae bacterium]|jgi:cell division protein DivIC|nr:septum formation initiator family protein [Prolixibacteraceae bacterium]MBT6006798.1 septum formation initiator family protein [Prolixibacteraceae bacterium]MBT6765786.1 septum formation initiator family protein [Prolixibacteraceae bacterium]MBT6997205.1 septum formation initiator family protein [Prolixibacteraceae bacterium]MBT7393752.1 septum formation initiator family protein [Prolixibacteraceae bacterium]
MEKQGLKESIVRLLSNKYFIASILFLAWLFFFDENSIIVQQKNNQQLKELIQQEEYYIERIASDRQKLENLKSGKEELEKFAREQYYMSKPDEDIFIVVEED